MKFYLIIIMVFLFSCSNIHKGTVWYNPENYYIKKNSKMVNRNIISTKETTNPLKIFSFTLIRLYQKLFSSQDGESCQFNPSCSAFGIRAIKKYSVRGLFMTGDRLIRCNPYTYGIYPIYKDGRHHYDTIDQHSITFSELFDNTNKSRGK